MFFRLRLAASGISLYYVVVLGSLLWRKGHGGSSLWPGSWSDDKITCLVWVFVPLLVFIVSVGRDPRYFLPPLPGIAVAIGLVMKGSGSMRKRSYVYFAFPIAVMLLISFVPSSIFSLSLRGTVISFYRVLGASFHNPPLERRNWRAHDIVNIIWHLGPTGSPPLRTVVLVNHPQFYFQLFNYVARLEGKPMVFVGCEDITTPFSINRATGRFS